MTTMAHSEVRIFSDHEEKGAMLQMKTPPKNGLLSLSLSLAVLLAAVSLQGQDFNTQFVSLPGTTIDAPGNYVLRSNMAVIPSGPAGIVITGNGVTLDLNGNQIRGPGGKQGIGIMIDGASGVKVVNGQLANLAFGVVVNESSNVVMGYALDSRSPKV